MEIINYFVNSIKNNYINFNGRARRKEFWYFFLVMIVISVVLGFLGKIGLILSSIVSLAILLPGIGIAVRRMHDVGKSGWFCLIPIYNIVLAATPGEIGDNQYGKDPKADEHN